MSIYTPLAEKVADRTGVQLRLPSDVMKLGVDTTGAEHYYSRIAHTVVVIGPNQSVERREDLGDRLLETWIDYVEAERGWEQLLYADSLADIVADALEVA
jgi:hypothetical protein